VPAGRLLGRTNLGSSRVPGARWVPKENLVSQQMHMSDFTDKVSGKIIFVLSRKPVPAFGKPNLFAFLSF
jgi:hypothetical protein